MIPPRRLQEYFESSGVEVVEGKPGDAVLFHASLVRGSDHNISPKNRMICLVQMNTLGTKPMNVEGLSVSFNIKRATAELEEAERRINFFKEKLLRQRSTTDVTFGAPIPPEERRYT
jgi:ectoine hydroxylase-related dioxygenase (phytanoyl-CoA dioxygenase family)